MSTLMFYLNDVEAGGYTAFPRLGVAVRYIYIYELYGGKWLPCLPQAWGGCQVNLYILTIQWQVATLPFPVMGGLSLKSKYMNYMEASG